MTPFIPEFFCFLKLFDDIDTNMMIPFQGPLTLNIKPADIVSKFLICKQKHLLTNDLTLH